MASMNDGRGLVVGGVDSHADTHAVAVLDERGVLLATSSFAATIVGYRALLAWLRSFGEVDRVGVESTGSYAAALTRSLVAEGVVVLEINQPHPHTRHRRGKSDLIDAELAARHALSLQTSCEPKRTDGIVESIRQLRVARRSQARQRSAGDFGPTRRGLAIQRTPRRSRCAAWAGGSRGSKTRSKSSTPSSSRSSGRPHRAPSACSASAPRMPVSC